MLHLTLLLSLAAAAPGETWLVLQADRALEAELRAEVLAKVKGAGKVPVDVSKLHASLHDMLAGESPELPAPVLADLRAAEPACTARSAGSPRSGERLLCFAQARQAAWFRHLDRERPPLVLHLTAGYVKNGLGTVKVQGEAYVVAAAGRRVLSRTVQFEDWRRTVGELTTQLIAGGGKVEERPVTLELPAAPATKGPLFEPLSASAEGDVIPLPAGCAVAGLPSELTVTPAGTLLPGWIAASYRLSVAGAAKGPPLACEAAIDTDVATDLGTALNSTAVRLRCGELSVKARHAGFRAPEAADAPRLAQRAVQALLASRCK